MDGGPSCPGSSAPHLPPTHPRFCLLSLLCTMDTVLTAQSSVLTTASIMSLVRCPCARTRQRSETSASSRETCTDGGVTCNVISPYLSSHWLRYGLLFSHPWNECPEMNCWPKPQQCEHCMSPLAVGLTRLLLPVQLQNNLSYSRDSQARWGLPGARVGCTLQLETPA